VKSTEYWAGRMELLNENLMQKADAVLPDIQKAYETAAENIQQQIEAFYQRYAGQEGISLAEAKRLLAPKERQRFGMTIEGYIKAAEQGTADPKWIRQLERTAARQRISRLEALRLQMRQQVELLEGWKDTAITRTLGEIFQECFYQTGYEIQRGLGVGAAFATLDTEQISRVLAKPWSPDGKNFSARIWGDDRAKLLHTLETAVTTGIITGDSPQRTIDKVRKAMGTSRAAAGRLVLTEGAAFAAMGRKECYERLGVKQFAFLATLDAKTCGVCADMDGQVFDLEDYQIGVTAPPLHPFDRCTTVPHFDDEFSAENMRAARDGDGKTYYVPADMTYKKWKKTFVEDGDTSDFKEVTKGIFHAAAGSAAKVMDSFIIGLEGIQDETVRNVFNRLAEDTPVHTSFRKNSYYRKGEIYLTGAASPSTIAHELFHKLDHDYGISESGHLTQSIRNDYQRLKNMAEGYGGTVEDLLYSKYPEMFEKAEAGNFLLKEKYRGISDILGGMSKNEVHLGYVHKDVYWERPYMPERETWAQFGRMLYQGDEAVIETLEYICPETYAKLVQKFAEVRKNVLR
jgi:SPP1 gp7 family putative phage head morphogenesis protein